MSGRRRTCSPKVQTSLDSVNHTDSVPLRNGNKPVEAKRRVRRGDGGFCSSGPPAPYTRSCSTNRVY